MKVEIMYIVQLMLIFSISTFMYMYFKYYSYERKSKHNLITSKIISKIRLDFSNKFAVNEYKAYEKIDIWRYCVLF